MADVSTAVRRLQIETTVTGASDAAAQLGRLNSSYQSNSTAATAAEKAGGQYESRLVAMQRQVDAMTRTQIAQNVALAANAAALSNSNSAVAAANDNASKSFASSGIEVAAWANRLKTAGEAAYTFSPAFRSVVNGLAAPALNAASTALVAVASGMVLATNAAGSGLVRLGAAAAAVAPSFPAVSAGITSAGIAMQAFNPTLTSLAGAILSKLLPALRLLGAVSFVVNAAKLVGEAWELGGQKLEEYRQIAEKAAAVDLSVTYFQKLTKGAEDAKIPVDALTKAFTSLQAASADQLGGSALQNRLDASVKAGNFAGNSGVQAYAQANTTQQRYEAIVSLIHQAMEDGQRLAALDIAKTAFGTDAADNLRKDAEYFDRLNAAAAKISDTQIVSPEDVSRALDLKNRYDAAVTILEQRWHPVQDLLTDAGIKMQEAWVGIVEQIAKAVTGVTDLVMKIAQTDWNDLATFFGYVQKGANAAGKWITDNTTTAASRSAAETSFGISSDPVEMAKGTDAYSAAVDKLRIGLQNQAAVQQGVSETNTVAQKVLGDTSHAIDTAAKATSDHKDALDRAMDTIEKYIQSTNAAAKSVDAGAFEQQKAKTIAELTAAAMRDGKTDLAQYADEWDKLGARAGQAALDLAKAQVQSQIKFDRATINLTPEDAQIASQLRKIYPDVTTALNSTEAAQIRLNGELRDAKDITAGFGNDLVGGLLRGEDAMKSLTSAASNLIQKLASKNLSNFLNGGSLFGDQSLASAQGALGVASAGVAGYQSGNPLTGALGGAMAGATFGPAGAVVGGVAGLIGGIFGADAQSKAKLEAAKQTWKDAAPAFDQFINTMTGGVQGDLAASFQNARQQFSAFQKQAREAQDAAGEARATDALMTYIVHQAQTFVSTFQATMQGLADGLGQNSPFLQAVTNVKSQLDNMKKFVDDTKTSFNVLYGSPLDDPNTGVQNGAAKGNGDALAQLNAQINAAQASARTYLLSLLQTPPALSEVQTAILNVNGTAEALQGALTELGYSADQAAAAIRDGVSKALDAIKAQFEEGLSERLNTANGQGYLNDATALLKQHAQDVTDAASLGVSQSEVAAVFHAEAQKIVDDAGLVGDSFTQFMGLFPDFNGVVKESATALAAAADQITASIKTINDYLASLKLGDNSTLSPQEKLNEAQSQFNAQLTLAQKGNADAMGTITQYASSLLDQAKAFYASSAGYGDVYGAVTDALKGLTGTTGMATGGMVPGYAAGGVVGNGMFGVDSVIARYAGGGSIGLAGGEFVMPAAQTQMHLPMLEAMRSGSASNDNGIYFASLGQQLVRAMAGCSMGEIAAIREENAALRADIRALTAAVAANKPKAPRPADRGRAA
jgi:hypothetical protein